MTENKFDPTESFLREVSDLIVQLEDALMRLEDGDHSKSVVDEAFRAMHTIKGSGSMFGFDKVAEFTHHFETAFDQIRAGKVEVTPELTDLSFQALDYIKQMIDDEFDEDKASNIIKGLSEIVSDVSADTPSSDNDVENDVDESDSQTPGSETTQYEIIFYPAKETFQFGGKPELIIKELMELGECKVTFLDDKLPSLEDYNPEECMMGWRFELETSEERDAIDDVFMFHEDDSILEIKELSGEDLQESKQENSPEDSSAAQTKTKEKPEANKSREVSQTIRIPSEKLDFMMDQVGELVIAQSRLAEICSQNDISSLRAISEDIERLVMDLRDQTLSVRMLPIGMLFGKFKRVVRDLSKDLDKKVDFISEGEDTEVDKSFIDKLNDPIVHLIRNSLDHGIEDPETRLAKGKPENGTLTLSARQTGGEILITIEDDGKGLDADVIKAKAIENNVITADAELSEEEIFALIFEAGFSTATEVSNVSGRGVGMDVVRRGIEDMRGKVDIASTKDEGTTLTLRLPLTLAIIEGYHVQVGNEVFVMPLELVEECVELSSHVDKQSDGRNLITIRDEFIPYIRLHDAFDYEVDDDAESRVVVVNVKGQRVGLVVDHIFGQRQTVIKPLTKIHSGISGLAGATILGDGRVALILDVPGLVENQKTKIAVHASKEVA